MIVDLRTDVLPFLGMAGGATGEEKEALNILLIAADRAVKNFCGTSVETASHTHYLPLRFRRNPAASARTWFEKQADKAVEMTSVPSMAGDRLVLPEVPVTAISHVYEDHDAYGDQIATDFPASSELTEGEDFWLWQFESGMCRSGLLMRRGTVWPSRPGTVKVEYTAGWTADQLAAGPASPIKLAVLIAIQSYFASWGEGGTALKAERLGDYAVTYATDAQPGQLPKRSKKLLVEGGFVHVGRKLG